MEYVQFACWAAVILAAAAFAVFLAKEGWRYAVRARNLAHILANSRVEESPLPRSSGTPRGRGLEVPRPPSLPPVPHQYPVPPPGAVTDGMK